MYRGLGSLLYRNSLQGTLSSDGRHVYAIDDLPLPPHPVHFVEMEGGRQHHFGPLTQAIYHNRLVALDAGSGAPVWTAGGRGRGVPADLADAYFLGPPLPLGSGVYAMVEKNQDLRLVCLGADHGDVLWSQHLASASDRMLFNVNRRVHAVHLAYRDGLLICPTNAGVVVAIDVLSRSLVWAQTFPRLPANLTEAAPEGQAAELNPAIVQRAWQGGAPLLAEGRVVLTGPDMDSLCCLRQSDGVLLWKVNRGDDDQYLAAVHQRLVLVVGRTSCRALSLTTGQTAWQLPSEAPAGQGVLTASPGKPAVYYLPLQSGDLLAIHFDRPRESARIARRGSARLGNLVFHGSTLWSQSATELLAFAPLHVQLAAVEERLKRNAEDLDARLQRARLRLDQGDAAAAAADLRRALPRLTGVQAGQVRGQLFAALTLLLERDFPAAEKYLDECWSLAEAPLPARERRRRQATLLALLAQGRQRQGRPAEALAAYRRLDEELGGEDLLLRLGDDPAVQLQPGWWARQRAAELTRGGAANALPQREARVERLGQTAERRQVLTAAWELIDLEQSTAPAALRARALRARARLLIDHGLLADGLDCLRCLARDFPGERFEDGRIGTDLLEDLSTDKRLIALLEDRRSPWEGRTYRVSLVPGFWALKANFASEIRPPLLSEQEADRLFPEPLWRAALSVRHVRLQVDSLNGRLAAINRATGGELWSVALPAGVGRAAGEGTWDYCLTDHLGLVTNGRAIVAVDLISRRVLWSRDLLDVPVPPGHTLAWDGLGRCEVATAQTGRLLWRLGLVGPVGRAGVFVQTRAGLAALDPLTGWQRWLRTDVPRSLEVFGDEQHLFAVDMEMNEALSGVPAVRSVHAVGTQDGLRVGIPDALPAVQNDKRILGRCLLVQDPGPGEAVLLRLYDVLTGRDHWKQQFPKGSILLDATERDVAAVAQPDGVVALIDLQAARTGGPSRLPRQVLVDRKHLEGLLDGKLLLDGTQLYLLLNKPPNAAAEMMDAGSPFQGDLRNAELHGTLCAFDRNTGARRWHLTLPGTGVLLERFDELPVILCAALVQKQANPNASSVPILTLRSIDKRTGKTLFHREMASPGEAFHSLLFDSGTGTIELLGTRMKLRHVLESQKK
jgi:outer membrane protein assembly factor BamB